MEKSTFIGLVLGLIAVGLGMVLKGASLTVLWNPAAILIIFVGTAATLFMGFPLKELKKFPTLIKLIFTEQKLMPKTELIALFVNLATITRREGLLALDNHLENVEDEFLKSGVQMIIDGSDIEFVKNVMLEEIEAIEERHRAGALIFSQAGTYAPTLGVLGAVVGLIAALGNLSDIDVLGHSIAAAFVATLMGIFSGYVLWHPIANKLKRLSSREMELKHIMVEGVVAIGSGISPIALEQYLMVYLSQEERANANIQKEGAGDDQ
ncbi:flagellar motor stator protein MotA [Peptococcaceae bacterium 1198_IL3148]